MNRAFFSTANTSEPQRAAYWTTLVSDTFVELECQIPTSAVFNGQIDCFQADELQFFTLASSPHRVIRTKERIAKSVGQDFLLTLQTSGRGMATQSGRNALMNRGDFTLIDTTRPYDLHFEGDFSQIVLRLPRGLILNKLVDIEDLTARQIYGSQGMGKLASTFLEQLPQTLDEINPLYLATLQSTAMDLIATAAAERLEVPLQASSRHVALRRRVSAYIDYHIADADLSCESIAAAHGISPRHLSKLFEKSELHVSQLIWARRLERVRQSLTDPLQSHLSITRIGYETGFKDASHLSRLFKSTYGETPREWRGKTLTAT